MTNQKDCLITGKEIIDRFGISYLDDRKTLPVYSYNIEINEKKYRINTLSIEEDLIIEKYSEILKEISPKLLQLIENSDKKVQGIFSWNGYKNYENLIKLENLINEFFQETNKGSF